MGGASNIDTLPFVIHVGASETGALGVVVAAGGPHAAANHIHASRQARSLITHILRTTHPYDVRPAGVGTFCYAAVC
jgi:hypothetical protein